MFSLHDTPSSASGTTTPPLTPPTTHPVIQGCEILEVLGYGGMGVVYKVRQSDPGRVVALKMLSAGLRARPSELARFEKEVQAARPLTHPNIVKVFDVGKHEGLPYVTMEYMDRGSLAEVIDHNPLPPRRAAEVIELLARAVHTAHQAGIIHRDIKPANVLLATAPVSLDMYHPAYQTLRLLGVPKVADFGLAKRMDEEGGQTRTGAVMGTPAYMAPEQAMGKNRQIGPAADVWALGAILYECLTGQPPFQAATMLETLDLVRTQDPAAPSSIQGGLPRDLETICLKCLEKDPAARYASADELADELRRYLDGLSIQARPTPRWRRAWRGVKRHAMAVTVVFLALTTAALGASLLMPRGKRAGADGGEATRVAYFSHFVKRWGVPEGVGPLSDEQVRRAGLSFRFHYRGKQVEKVEAIDRRGRPNPRHHISTYLSPNESGRFAASTLSSYIAARVQRLSLAPGRGGRYLVAPDAPCSWEYQRDDQGNLVKEVAYDVAGRVVWTFQLTANDTWHYINERGLPLMRGGSGASYVKLVHDDGGLVREVRYLSRNGKPRPDPGGVFARRLEHDKVGLVTAVSYLGARDRPVEHPLGYARVVRRWDNRGHLLEEAYLDLRGKPSRGFFAGGAVLRWTYDDVGNPTSQEILNLEGKPGSGSVRMTYDKRGNLRTWELVAASPRGDRPVARRVLEYDEHDNCTLIRTFGFDGKPVLDPVTASCGMALTHDEDGRVAAITFLGLDGKPAEADDAEGDDDPPVREREVRIAYRYNVRGQVLSEECFGLDGNPVADVNGGARYTCAYDDAGRPIDLALFDAHGNSVRGQQGFARRTWSYDEQGRLEETATYDTQGNLTALEGTPETPMPGAAGLTAVFLASRFSGTPSFAVGRLKLGYDDRGNLDSMALYGRGGEPIADAQGVAKVHAKYDELGNLEELASFDAAGAPKANADGVARSAWAHDSFGNLTEMTTYGPDGKLVASVYGVARHKRHFDDHYNLVEEEFFGPDGEPTLGALGYARAHYEYDKDDNLTKSLYYGADGKPVATRAVWMYSANRVLPPSEGAEARPERGDVLLSYDGEEVRCARLFAQRKQREEQGAGKKEVRILRKGKEMVLRIPTGVLRRDDFFRFGGRGRGGAAAAGVPGMLEPSPFVQTRGVKHLAAGP
jgi:tRNA A-37 threonylcarbamoyl transferase component Bud32